MDGSLGVGEDPCPLDDAPDSWYRYSIPHTKEEEAAAASAKSVPDAKNEDDKKKKENWRAVSNGTKSRSLGAKSCR